jgi:hypothetical protein
LLLATAWPKNIPPFSEAIRALTLDASALGELAPSTHRVSAKLTEAQRRALTESRPSKEMALLKRSAAVTWRLAAALDLKPSVDRIRENATIVDERELTALLAQADEILTELAATEGASGELKAELETARNTLTTEAFEMTELSQQLQQLIIDAEKAYRASRRGRVRRIFEVKLPQAAKSKTATGLYAVFSIVMVAGAVFHLPNIERRAPPPPVPFGSLVSHTSDGMTAMIVTKKAITDAEYMKRSDAAWEKGQLLRRLGPKEFMLGPLPPGFPKPSTFMNGGGNR